MFYTSSGDSVSSRVVLLDVVKETGDLLYDH